MSSAVASQTRAGDRCGGLTLMNRFKAVVADPEVDYEISMTVSARDGWLVVESITVRGASGGSRG